ncbi:hypothetical protein B0H13DRAFT_2659492 [Mycena leptocephala]|nr:hypothetical protein B0H13DRAFT_2659492 [Mycena leptocephala]
MKRLVNLVATLWSQLDARLRSNSLDSASCFYSSGSAPIPGLQSRIQRRNEGAHLSGPMRPVVGVDNVVKVGNSSHVAFSSNWARAAFESRTPYPPCSLTRPRHRAGCSTIATAALHQIRLETMAIPRAAAPLVTTDVSARSTHLSQYHHSITALLQRAHKSSLRYSWRRPPFGSTFALGAAMASALLQLYHE